ncbi:MAG: hypothetical protein LBS96_05775 [Oscillospiraceae bacterium]|nr:hypothetical protein [Oscillospiraceae bacterium]
MKKTLGLLLAAIAVLALFAGCQPKDLDNRTTGTTSYNLDLTPDKVEQAKNEVGITGDALTPEEEALLQSKLHDQGYEVTFEDGELQVKPPEGVTLPATTATTATVPKTMPAGESVDAAEAKKLLQGVQAIFDSRVFTLTAKGTSGVFGSTSGFSSVVMAVDHDKVAIESTGSIAEALVANSDTKEDYYGQRKVQAAIIETALGKRYRMLVLPEKFYCVFPDRNIYLDFAAFAIANGADPGDLASSMGDPSAIIGGMFGGDTTGRTVTSTKVKAEDGKEYICATTKDEETGITHNFYFLGKDLKRIETIVPDPDKAGETLSTVLDVESLVATADPKYFTIDGMTPLDLLKFAQLLGG